MSLTSVEFEKKKKKKLAPTISPKPFSFLFRHTLTMHRFTATHRYIALRENEWADCSYWTQWQHEWQHFKSLSWNRRHWTLMGEKTKRMKDKGSGTYWKRNISWKRTWGSNITTWNWHQEVINEMLASIRCQSKQSLWYMYSTMPLHNKWVTESISASCICLFLF